MYAFEFLLVNRTSQITLFRNQGGGRGEEG
jgi:hypothetical protein